MPVTVKPFYYSYICWKRTEIIDQLNQPTTLYAYI